MQLLYTLVSPTEPGQTLPGIGGRSKQDSTTQLWLWALIGIGIFLRLFHYIDNRSLWIDEVYLSTSLVKMDFWQLATSELDYQQKAPIGFLWLVRLSVLLFGKGEMALRLIPLLSGIAALFVFRPVVNKMLKPLGAVMAMALLAVAPVLVYHAVEIKQYSTEMFATVLSLYLYCHFQPRLDLKSLLIWGFSGALILWFSYSSIFLLAGIAISLSLYYLLNKQWKWLFLSLIPFGLWLISFAINFYLFTYKQTEAEWLVEWFRVRGGFPPLNASVGAFGGWLFQSLYRYLDYPMGVLWNASLFNHFSNPALRILPKMPVFLFLFWIIGIFSYYKRDRKHFGVLLLPIALTLLATIIEKYPFYDRLLVFLAPVPIILLAQGCQKLTSFLPLAFGKARFLLPFILLFWPFWRSANQLADTTLFGGYKHSYYRDGMLYLKENMQEGDLVYVYWNAKPFFNLYNDIYNLNIEGVQLSDVRLSSENTEDYLNKLRPEYAAANGKKRVWFIYDPWLVLEIGDYDHQPPWYLIEGIQGGTLLHKDFTSKGRVLDSFKREDVEVQLYDLSEKKE